MIPRSPKSSSKTGSSQTLKSEFPSAKLAPVTRKKNEILQLLPSQTLESFELVKAYFNEYHDKKDVFISACEMLLQSENYSRKAELQKWYLENSTTFNHFEGKVKIYMERFSNATDKLIDDIRPEDSASNVGSSKSVISSVRLRLSQEKAKLSAEIMFAKEKAKLEKERKLEELAEKERNEQEEMKKNQERRRRVETRQLEYEEKLAEIEAKSKTEQQRVMEEEMERLSGINSKSKLSCSNVMQNLVTSKVETASNQGFLQVLQKQNDMLMRSQQKALLNLKDLEKLDGKDSTEYKSFIRTFERVVESKCEDDDEKFFYLEQCTKDRPRQLVKSCKRSDASTGYQEARRLLDREYGNDYKIANIFLQKIKNWDLIKSEDGEALNDFSLYLQTCLNYMGSIDTLSQLNSPSEIKNVIAKLPFELKRRWRDNFYDILEKKCKVEFKDVVDFVKIQADKLTLPLFGNLNDFGSENTKKSKSVPLKKSFATSSKEKEKSSYEQSKLRTKQCVFCKKDNHYLAQCIHFDKKPYNEKVEFIKSSKLCFGCLVGGHFSKDCKRRHKCKFCQKSHPTCLHNERTTSSTEEKKSERKSENEESKDIQAATAADEGACATAKSCATKYGKESVKINLRKRVVCTAIPVKIRVKGHSKAITTYMGLDNFSTDCFMDEKLVHQLGLKGNNEIISLTTMEKIESAVKTIVINNLEIMDLEENKKVAVPVVYANRNWPFNKDDVHREEDTQDHAHLEDIPFNFVDSYVGILIGMNMPELIKPLKIVEGKAGTPYASQHLLGWALNGPIAVSEKTGMQCCRVKLDSTDLENKIDAIYSMDYMDSHDVTTELSVQDKKWNEKVTKSLTHLPNSHYEIELPFKEDHDPSFPSNYGQVYARVMSLRKQFEGSPSFYKDYLEFMNMMLEFKFAEKIPIDELRRESGHTWYIAHHGVYHKQKKKLRVVFNCSMRYQGVSLNDFLCF